MKTSDLFNSVMALLWDFSNENLIPKEAVAIASYIKTHRINSENAFEVLAIMWPDSSCLPRDRDAVLEPDTVLFDVQFADKSQCIIISARGIGNGVEVLS